MRVLYVCADPGVPVFGSKGCSVHVQEMVRAMRAAGDAVELAAARRGGPPPSDLASVPFTELGALAAFDADRRARLRLAANRALRRLVAERAPDLVYERFSLWSHGAIEGAAALGVASALEVNAPLIEEEARFRELVHRGLAERAAGRALGAAGRVVAVSNEVAGWALTRGAAGHRILVVPNGVSPQRFPPRLEPALPAAPGVFTVGFLGGLRPWHGIDILAAAFEKLRANQLPARLLVVGDGPERTTLAAAAERWGWGDALVLVGAVPPAAVPSYLASMDVSVAPYPPAGCYFSPLKVVESMAAGVPVVASAVGQLVALVEDGQTGILCRPGDPAALASALALLRNDRRLRLRLGAAGRRRALARFTWDHAWERIRCAATRSTRVSASWGDVRAAC